MNSKNSLIIGRGIFLIIVVVSLGLIIMNEKGGALFQQKASQKIEEYIEENFKELPIEKGETVFKDNGFITTIKSKKNSHHTFQIQYKNRKITDTFQEDFKEGKTLFQHINKSLEKEIKKRTKIDVKIKEINTLDKYSEKVQERIIKEENLLELKYYYLQKELTIKEWNPDEVTNSIEEIIQVMNEKNITPKYYDFTITNADDITTSIIIHNIPSTFNELEDKKQIIEDILNNKETDVIKENKITFEYQN